jgi:hypothetical protein
VDAKGQVATDGQFQVDLCPRWDHFSVTFNVLRLCTLSPVRSPAPGQSLAGVVQSVAVNSGAGGDNQGYVGIELVQAPSNPGTYYIKFEALAGNTNSYRIREQSDIFWDSSLVGESAGAWALVVVAGGEFLDGNFHTFPRGVIEVTQPTLIFLRYLNFSGAGPATATLTSLHQDGTVLQTGVSLPLNKAGSSQAYVGSFTAVPERYTGAVSSPSIQIALGSGRLQAAQATAAPLGIHALRAQSANGTLLADDPTASPGVLVLKFITRDGTALTPSPDGDPSHAGTVQQTEIGTKSEDYAEKLWLEIQAVNPIDKTQIQDTNGSVGITETPNSTLTDATKQFYDGANGGTKLYSDGKIGDAVSGGFVTMAHGRAQVQLKAVADARIDRQTGKPVGTLPYATLLQPVPSSPGDPSMPAAGGSTLVNQWVDERTYDRRRTDPSKTWTASDTPNSVRDWIEKKAWDTWTDTPDDGTGELDAGCRVIVDVKEDVAQTYAGLVFSTTPWRVTFNPLMPQLRHPLLPGGFWWKMYYGFYNQADADGFPEIALHESRHSWQFTMKSRGGIDADNDFLLAPGSTPVGSEELIDASNVAATAGGNGDGHFKGDTGNNSADVGEAPHTMEEHNAMRFTRRQGSSLDVSCVISAFSLLSGDGQTAAPNQALPQPLVVSVMSQVSAAGGTISTEVRPGTTIKFSVIGSGTAKVNGAATAYSMTNDSGLASVIVTNGSGDSQIQAVLLPPMTPQNVCGSRDKLGAIVQSLPSTVTFTVHVQ